MGLPSCMGRPVDLVDGSVDWRVKGWLVRIIRVAVMNRATVLLGMQKGMNGGRASNVGSGYR